MYVHEARRGGQTNLSIQAGEIVRELHLNSRVPAVCSALASKKFQEENGLVLELVEGPKSGMSTTTRFTYRLSDPVEERARVRAIGSASGFLALRGAGAKTYAALGGGEEHLTAEREAFTDR